jgi:hypothetical protein
MFARGSETTGDDWIDVTSSGAPFSANWQRDRSADWRTFRVAVFASEGFRARPREHGEHSF